jgi:competence protein ComEC
VTTRGLRLAPHLPLLAVCVGLSLSNLVRLPGQALLLACALALGSALGGPRARVALLLIAALAGAWCLGSARLGALDRSILARHAGETELMRAVVTAPVRRGSFDLRVRATVERFGRQDLHEDVLLKLPLGRAPPQGSRLAFVGRVTLPRPAARGFDERVWLRRQGVHVVVHGQHWRIVGRRGGLAGIGDRLHERLARTIAPGVTGERRAVVAGIVLGEDEALSDELRDRFRASGLYHLLAVSGQNVAFLAGGVLALAWLLGVPRWLGEVGVLAAVCGYVLAVGWQPSVVRAGVAGCLASLAWLSSRQRDRWHFLLLGAVVLLAWNPYSLLESGFQLSFAAVAAIFVAVPRLERAFEGYPVPPRAAAAVAVSAVCGLVTAPILWLQFGAVPVFAVVANALAAPVVAPLLGLGLLAAVVEPVAPPVAATLGYANGWMAAYLALCARVVGGLPHAQVTSSAGLAVLAVLVGLAAAAARLRGPSRRLLAAALALAALLAAGWRLVPDRPSPPTGLRVVFLDVGQGDSILVQTPRAALLVDQGPPEARVASQLERLGVRHLALLVLTHPQRDHVGGAAQVLDRVGVDAVFDPRLPADSPDESAALAAARRHRVPVVTARSGRRYRLGRLLVTVLWPDDAGAAGDDPNDHAVVLLLTYGSVDLLLTADAESNVTGRLRLPPVEVLKVAHHGSADPGLPALLEQTRPRVAVISVGQGNDYGHPTTATLRALADVPSLDVYRTDLDGRVTIESDGERIRVSTTR